MQTALSHLIGTTAMLGIMSILIAASFQISASQRVDIDSSQLQEVTDYVALNMYDLILASVNFSSTNLVIWKQMSIPTSVDQNGYSMALSSVGGSISVSAWINTEPFVKASSIIPFNCTNGNLQVSTYPDGYNLGGVIVKTTLTSGPSLPVCWIQITSNGITIGLGLVKG